MNTYTIKDITYEELRSNVFNKLPKAQKEFLNIMRYWYKHPTKTGLYVTFGYYNEYKCKNQTNKPLDELYDIYYPLYDSIIQIEGKDDFSKIVGKSWITGPYIFLEYVYDDVAESLIEYLKEEHNRVLIHIKYPYKHGKFPHELKRPFIEIK